MDCNSVAGFLREISYGGPEVVVKLFIIIERVPSRHDGIVRVTNAVSEIFHLMKDIAEELRRETATDDTPVVNIIALQDIMTSADTCQSLIQDLQCDIRRADSIVRKKGLDVLDNVRLSRAEKARWPFSQPRLEGLIEDLLGETTKLSLVFLVIRLARSQTTAEPNMQSATKTPSQQYLVDGIKLLQNELHPVQRPRAEQKRNRRKDAEKHGQCAGKGASDTNTEASLGAKSHGELVDELPQSPDRLKKSKANISLSNAGIQELGASNKSVPDQIQVQTGQGSSVHKDGHNRPGTSESNKLSSIPEHAENKDSEKEGQEKKVLELHFIQAYPRFWDYDTGELAIGYQFHHRTEISQATLAEEVKRINSGPVAIIDQFTQLSAWEHTSIDKFLRLHPNSVLISVHKEEPKTLHYDTLTINGACDMRVIIEISPVIRPAYIRCHSKHLALATLATYELPWMWDEYDPNFIIIKQWIPESDLDILFEHTRRLRDRLRPRPRRSLPLPSNRRIIIRERHHRTSRGEDLSDEESDAGSDFSPSDDSDTEGTGSMRGGKRTFKSSKSSPAEEERSEKYDVVKELLTRYTTLFDMPEGGKATVVGEPELSINEQPLATPAENSNEKYEFV